MSKKIAVLVDGGFFDKRLPRIYGREIALNTDFFIETLNKIAYQYIRINGRQRSEIYRIFYYDCPPISKQAHYPISRRACKFDKSDVALFRNSLHKELVKLRKVALRLGVLNDAQADWQLQPNVLKDLLNKRRKYEDLTDNDFFYDVKQKQIDMKIGLDITSLSYKNQVEQIVLISGDSDFVPAAKIARREGIDFILDPMWSHIRSDLFEHVDGIYNAFPKPEDASKSLIYMQAG